MVLKTAFQAAATIRFKPTCSQVYISELARLSPRAFESVRNQIFGACSTQSQAAPDRHEGAKAEKAVPFSTARDRAKFIVGECGDDFDHGPARCA